MPDNQNKRMDSNFQTSIPAVLTIAGSDCSGGAGIQADLKTMLANGVYGMSAITALTAQNTTGVRSVMEASSEFLADQLDMIFSDIVPSAVKIGMVSSTHLINVIAEKLTQYKPSHVVVDPVMVATSGAVLMQPDAKEAMMTKLFPLAEIITPNFFELKILCADNFTNDDVAGQIAGAKKLADRYGCAVLVKGGHTTENANDYLIFKKDKSAKDFEVEQFSAPRLATKNTHGTGCTLSSAIASQLAKGCSLDVAVARAKKYIQGALMVGQHWTMAKGCGPLAHGFDLKSEFI